MNFSQAISSGFSNYVNFRDRACRSEYWYWVLFILVAEIVTAIIDNVTGIPATSSILFLVTLIPGIAVSVRRLHDLDRTGWWLLISLIPLIGAIILLVWFISKGTDGPNRFGPDPLASPGGQISPRPAT
jgi:uncharacterized membrane protein YhaH (DUF805 family)